MGNMGIKHHVPGDAANRSVRIPLVSNAPEECKRAFQRSQLLVMVCASKPFHAIHVKAGTGCAGIRSLPKG